MGRKVLTVDDSRTIREMVSFALKPEGYEIFEAENGKKALEFLASQSVDLVITDVNMPEMDGITLIKELRKNPNFQRIPILVLTTESDDSKKNSGREAGATGWVVKPFDPQKLVDVVRKVCP